MITNNKYHRVIGVLCFLLCQCTTIDVYEKNQAIPHYEWKRDFSCTGSFDIVDTSSNYNLFLVLRHTDAFKYENIWLTIQLYNSKDTLSFLQQNFILGNDAGGWKGTGMNDIWEVRELVNDFPVHFPKKGTYSFIIKNNMRDNPLKDVMSAGLRIEKVQ